MGRDVLFAAAFGFMHPVLHTMLSLSDRTTGLCAKSCVSFYPSQLKRTTTNRAKLRKKHHM